MFKHFVFKILTHYKVYGILSFKSNNYKNIKIYLHLSAVKLRCTYTGHRERKAPANNLVCGMNSSASRRKGCS